MKAVSVSWNELMVSYETRPADCVWLFGAKGMKVFTVVVVQSMTDGKPKTTNAILQP